MHARLALNSSVYTDNQLNELSKAKDYATRLIDSGKYKLASNEKNGYSGYAQLFMADNDENMEAIQEIILPIRQDGIHTRCYSAANYLISSTRISGMPYAGTSNCWSCNYARPDLVEKFFPEDNIPMAKEDETAMNNYKKQHKIFSFKVENGDTLYLFKTTDETEEYVVDKNTPRTQSGSVLTGEYVTRDFTEPELIAYDEFMKVSTKDVLKAAKDDRALFYSGFGGGIRKIRTDKMNNFLDGISVVKFQNYRSDGGPTKDPEWPDMDIPLLRFAEAYLIRAEVNFKDGNTADALTDINVLRTRAHAEKLTDLSETELLDEWCREFYMEGRRRSDLNRFGRFVGGTYVWAWKGGVAKGQSVDNHFRFYPIPQDDINNNVNMSNSQNPGY